MLRPPTLKIVEVFASVQGEGLRQGKPTIFVRLAGCNLRCSFCDTAYAWTGGRDVAAAGIAAEIRALRKRFPASWVCLTGGEPMLQDTAALVRALKRQGLRVQVETNGTVYRPTAADWVTISPKPPDYKYDARFRHKAREVKIIVARNLTLAALKKIRAEFPVRTPLLLQPESNASWSRAKAVRLIQRSLRAGLENVRLSVQLHKIFDLR